MGLVSMLAVDQKKDFLKKINKICVLLVCLTVSEVFEIIQVLKETHWNSYILRQPEAFGSRIIILQDYRLQRFLKLVSNCHKRTSGKDDDLFLVGAIARHGFCFRAVRVTNAPLSLMLQPGERQQHFMGSFSYTPYLPNHAVVSSRH